jgi:hypothetical protein
VSPRRALFVALVAAGSAGGCGTAPELDLEIALPTDKTLLAAVTSLDLTATRDGIVLAHGTFSPTAGTVSLAGVSHGARTVFTLEGLASGSVVAEGRTCDIDFEGPGTKAPLYFAPTSFFAPTKSVPVSARVNPVAAALDDGTVLLAGGTDDTGVVLATSELFTPGLATFAKHTAVMNVARTRAQATALTSIGVLVTGGLGADGVTALGPAEIYFEAQPQFLVTVPQLEPRVDHRAVLLADGSVFVSGGSATDGGAPLATTQIVIVTTDGTFQVKPGPALVEARRAHAATVAVGIPLVFGGYGATGTPLDSIEWIDPSSNAAKTVAHLATARADATATLLANGSVLVVGGRGADGAALASGELYNPVTGMVSTTTSDLELAVARYGHTATLLADGRVLIAGGTGTGGKALDSVELFEPDLGGFVTERSLETARAGHVAVPLCDGTVLVAGGGAGAELYFGAAD